MLHLIRHSGRFCVVKAFNDFGQWYAGPMASLISPTPSLTLSCTCLYIKGEEEPGMEPSPLLHHELLGHGTIQIHPLLQFIA